MRQPNCYGSSSEPRTTHAMNESTGIKGRAEGVEPENEAEHFDVCPLCGQAFDMRDLDDVMRHGNPHDTARKLDA
jgi:hypothetical protein